MRCYLFMALICISLLIGDVEHLFKNPLITYMSFLENLSKCRLLWDSNRNLDSSLSETWPPPHTIWQSQSAWSILWLQITNHIPREPPGTHAGKLSLKLVKALVPDCRLVLRPSGACYFLVKKLRDSFRWWERETWGEIWGMDVEHPKVFLLVRIQILSWHSIPLLWS